MKSYTDIEHSKVLAKILPLESADYCWGIDDETLHYNSSPYPCAWKDYSCKKYYIPCWSLSALLSVIRETIGYTLYGVNNVYMSCDLGDKPWKLETEVYDNEVDACVEMILKLHELNLL